MIIAPLALMQGKFGRSCRGKEISTLYGCSAFAIKATLYPNSTNPSLQDIPEYAIIESTKVLLN